MITVEQAARYCGVEGQGLDDEIFRCLTIANDMVEQAIGNAWRTVPGPLEDECVLRATYAVWKQQTSLEGSTSFVLPDGSALPGVPNDPLRKCWEILKRYVDRV